MRVYQLKPIPERFKASSLDLMTLAQQIGGPQHLTMLMRQPATNEPLAPYWQGLTVADSWAEQSRTSTELPDVALWGRGCLILNKKAFEVLGKALASEGEFLPLQVDGEAHFVFNCLSFCKEDMTLSERKYLNGIDDGLKTLFFDDADVQGRMVFKSEQVGVTLYATESFKQAVEGAGLEGLRFDTDLLDPF
ncbi:hypothetical protein [Gallaecimonas pentaromativorans]|uniref:hypothetical protein n=1 Tax=Gallaecimonas pentaromativorans TaxID=584787 RepID=UPI003A946F70